MKTQEGTIAILIGIISLWFLVVFLVVASLLPVAKIPYGAIRGFEFPREQFCVLTVPIGLVAYWLQPNFWGIAACILLLLVAVFQLAYISKFTPVWPKQSVDAGTELRDQTARQISVLAANVKKSNRQYARLIDLIGDRNPDTVMAIEVDQDWIDALKGGVSEDYRHWVDVPMDNGYGLCLLSRLPLSETNVRELITDGVPSIRTAVKLPDGRRIRLYVVHPEPPVIDHDTIGRDSEIALVGLEAAQDELPTIVSGDLNDVAWSSTTRRFQRLSGLLDPRVGRGFYNTFNAMIPWMRWPLDHLFHDPLFRLVEMARLPKIGSDHFPMWFVLALAHTEAEETSPGEAGRSEEAETKKMIVQERRREREALGSDWEDE